MIITHNGKNYRVTETTVEVYVKQGEPRCMQLSPRSASWRTLKSSSKVAQLVRRRADTDQALADYSDFMDQVITSK